MTQAASRAAAVLAVAAGWVALGSASAPPRATQVVVRAPESTVDRVTEVFQRWNRSDSPGCSVGVAERGKPVLTRAFGMANLDNGIRLRADTVFDAGSIAKQVTAFAIGLLVADGKLALSDPARKYVPELPDFGSPITLQHLLQHTSGIRGQWPLLTMQGRPPSLALHTVGEILELVERQKELNFEPGDQFLYNNTGYTLLGVVVQRVSGQSLRQFSAERIFRPLGMNRTQWREDFARVVEGRASAYRLMPDGTFRLHLPFSNVVGAAGLLTTVGDLLIWNENLDNPRVGSRALVEQLQTRGRLNDGFETGYGLGIHTTQYRGVGEFSHNGASAGFQAFLGRYPTARLSVAVLCNTTGTDPTGLAHRVADIYLGARIKPEPTLPRVQMDPAALVSVSGVYRDPLNDAAMRVSYNEALKSLVVSGQSLATVAPDSFAAPDGRRFAVERDPAGRVAGLRETTDGARPRAWQLQRPFYPAADRLSDYAGSYYSEEIDKVYTVALSGNSLRVRFAPAVSYALIPVYEDAFLGEGTVIRFTRDGQGHVNGFLVYADRVWHLRFGRLSP